MNEPNTIAGVWLLLMFLTLPFVILGWVLIFYGLEKEEDDDR